MAAHGGDYPSRPTSAKKKRGSDDDDLMASASLEVFSATNTDPQGPAMYQATYTRGGWIWRTSHRYREWRALKETLRAEYGVRNLPHEEIFPQKEDMGAIFSKFLTSCQGCREGSGPVGILEDRRQGLQAYFSEILADHRDVWDGSEEIKQFFFPGPPTSYSAALSRRRSEQLKKAKEMESSRQSMASTFKSTFGSIFESSPSTTTSSPTREQPDDLFANTSPTVLGRLSSKMPSLRDFLFDAPPPPSQFSSKYRTLGREHKTRSGSTNKTASESGVTDPDGISDNGGSKHSFRE